MDQDLQTSLLQRGFREVYRRWVLRGLLIHPVGLGTLAILYWIYDPVPWKVALGSVGCLVLVVLRIRDFSLVKAIEPTPSIVLQTMVSVVAGILILIVLTGGILSPLVAALAVVHYGLVIMVGRLRHYLPIALFSVLVLWGLLWLELQSDRFGTLIPRIFVDAGGLGLTDVYLFTWAGLSTWGIALSCALGAGMRFAMDRSIEERVRAQGEAVALARDRNRELMTLTASLAHELKNPLASIRGLAGLLARRFKSDPTPKEQVTVLVSEAERMTAILNEFLNFSRPLGPLSLDEVQVNEVVASVLTLHQAMAAERGLHLSSTVRGPNTVACDSRKLTQVLLNLVQNALDATPPGGEVQVEVGPWRDGGVQVEVVDEGVGIDDALRGRLFTPGATTKAAGSGLGLTIAKTIAEQHGGELMLRERSEGGCCATLRLPVRPPEIEEENQEKSE